MKTVLQYSAGVIATTALVFLTGCAGMTHQEQGTAAGAVIGGVLGNSATGGLGGTAAGAVVGGVIGHEVTQRK